MFFEDIHHLYPVFFMLAVYLGFMQLAFGTVCPVKILTGWDCPGCGLTRGCLCVLTGQWKRAYLYNPASFAWVVLIAWLLWKRYFSDRNKINWELPTVLVALGTIGIWIYRIVKICKI